MTHQPKVLKFSREAKRFAEDHGFRDVRIERLKDHPVLKGTVNGKSVSLVLARKEDGSRMKKNLQAQLRRIARGAG